jgi:hypothetical protein
MKLKPKSPRKAALVDHWQLCHLIAVEFNKCRKLVGKGRADQAATFAFGALHRIALSKPMSNMVRPRPPRPKRAVK